MPRGSKAPKGLTQAKFAAEVADKAGLSKSDVKKMFDAMQDVTAGEIRAGRPVVYAGFVKIKVAHKAATPARDGINPFTKEPMRIKAKPARKVVKVSATSALKKLL